MVSTPDHPLNSIRKMKLAFLITMDVLRSKGYQNIEGVNQKQSNEVNRSQETHSQEIEMASVSVVPDGMILDF